MLGYSCTHAIVRESDGRTCLVTEVWRLQRLVNVFIRER